jgi:hypothetical protein
MTIHWNLLRVGPGKPTCEGPGKLGSGIVAVTFGGGKTAVEVEPAKDEAD